MKILASDYDGTLRTEAVSYTHLKVKRKEGAELWPKKEFTTSQLDHPCCHWRY